MVEFSPATREARVRFPASAYCSTFCKFGGYLFFPVSLKDDVLENRGWILRKRDIISITCFLYFKEQCYPCLQLLITRGIFPGNISLYFFTYIFHPTSGEENW